jgi:hypothetical protein
MAGGDARGPLSTPFASGINPWEWVLGSSLSCEKEAQGEDHQGQGRSEREKVAGPVPSHRLAQEQHSEHRDHDAHQIALQVLEIVDLEPARQG